MTEFVKLFVEFDELLYKLPTLFEHFQSRIFLSQKSQLSLTYSLKKPFQARTQRILMRCQGEFMLMLEIWSGYDHKSTVCVHRQNNFTVYFMAVGSAVLFSLRPSLARTYNSIQK